MIAFVLLVFGGLTVASTSEKKKPSPKLGEWESSDEVDENGRRMQKLQVQSPNLTEEDQQSVTLAKQYECSACRAVIFQTESALKKNLKLKKEIKEWDLIDIFEQVCTTNTFNDYGLSTVDGKNVLTGPGIEQEEIQKGQASIKMGGGKWPDHLKRMCSKMTADHEDELYAIFKKNKKIDKDEMCATEMFTYCESEQKEAKAKLDEKKRAAEKRKADKKNKKNALKEEREQQRRNEADKKIAVSDFLLEQEKLMKAPYASFSSARSSLEWSKLFQKIAESSKTSKDEL